MDRRQRKSRTAIFQAFTQLLSEKPVEKITVEQIIARADVGRATFYAHFETKDYLLKALCEELFGHIFASAGENGSGQTYIFCCEAPDSVFLHLFQHLQRNDNQILELLSGENNTLFLDFFKVGLTRLVENQLSALESGKDPALPVDFWIHHVAATFVETVRWWAVNGLQQTPEQINQFFLSVLHSPVSEGFLKKTSESP